MLSVAPGAEIFLAAGATDLRRGFDSLAEVVVNELEKDPLSGSLFVFCNRRRNRLKILLWGGHGYWLCTTRLEKGTFAWPETGTRSIELSPQELTLLIGGIDLKDTARRRWYRRESAVIAASV